MVGTDWLMRLTGRMDILKTLPVELKTVRLPKYCRSSRVQTEEFWRFLRSETVLALHIGIGVDRRKSITRGDRTYQLGRTPRVVDRRQRPARAAPTPPL